MKKLVWNSCLLLLIWSVTGRSQSAIQPQAGPAIDPSAFRYSRHIPESPAGLTALLLDEAVLAHGKMDLSDLRITDSDYRQIPYLIEKRPENFELILPMTSVGSSLPAKESRYMLELPFDNLPPAKLVLNTSEKTFQRNVSVQIKRSSSYKRSESGMDTVFRAIWRHSDPNTSATPLTFDLPSSLGTTFLTLVVDEGDNHPIALGTPHLELPLYRLRFFYPPNAKLTLRYGQDALSAPQYDLELLAPRLAGLSNQELALDPEAPGPIAPANRISAELFWAALIIAMAVVLGLLVRLLRSDTPD